MSPFYKSLLASLEQKVIMPEVIIPEGQINYFSYQLSVHLFNLKLMARGLKFKGITFKQIKEYYGLKGRSAADCLPQLESIMNDYKSMLAQKEQ